MKNIVTIFLALTSMPLVSIAASLPRYVITSECIITIEVQKSIYTQGWGLTINLTDSAAMEMLTFSKKHIGEKAHIVDGKGENIIKNEIRIQGHISSPFLVAGLSSQKEAINAKESILSTNGKCGTK